MATLETFTARAQQLIGGNRPGSATLDVFVVQARAKVDRAKPREVRNAITGDGSDEYTLPSPWAQGFSAVRSVEILGADGSEEAPERLTPEDWLIEQTTGGVDQIRLDGYAPADTETLVVYHTAPHTVSASTSTLLATDEEAFSELVAAFALRARLANLLSYTDQRTDSDRAAVDVAAAEQLRALERDLRKSAYAHFGIVDESEPTSSKPLSASRDADRAVGRGGIRQYRHTHPRRWA